MKTLTTQEKLNLIGEVEKGGNKRELAIKYGIAYATLCRIAKEKNALLARGHSALKKKRDKKLKFIKTDQAMDTWFAAMREKLVTVTGDMLKAKAKEFSVQLKEEGFQASNGWLRSFKERFAYVFFSLHNLCMLLLRLVWVCCSFD